MPSIEDIVREMRNNPTNIKFRDLERVCGHFFGESRVKGSHYKYKTPWAGNPRVNIQEMKGGKAKPYQVRQVLDSIDKLEGEKREETEEVQDDGEQV